MDWIRCPVDLHYGRRTMQLPHTHMDSTAAHFFCPTAHPLTFYHLYYALPFPLGLPSLWTKTGYHLCWCPFTVSACASLPPTLCLHIPLPPSKTIRVYGLSRQPHLKPLHSGLATASFPLPTAPCPLPTQTFTTSAGFGTLQAAQARAYGAAASRGSRTRH